MATANPQPELPGATAPNGTKAPPPLADLNAVWAAEEKAKAKAAEEATVAKAIDVPRTENGTIDLCAAWSAQEQQRRAAIAKAKADKAAAEVVRKAELERRHAIALDSRPRQPPSKIALASDLNEILRDT